MAVLPGIDANDEAKTAAVFQFYTSVLASLPALRGADSEDDDGADGGWWGLRLLGGDVTLTRLQGPCQGAGCLPASPLSRAGLGVICVETVYMWQPQ